MSNDRDLMLRELATSIRLLASRGAAVLSVRSAGSKAGDLASQFDEAREALLSDFGADLSEGQRRSLLDLDDAIVAMSSARGSRHWTQAALRNDPVCAAVRQRALMALDAFEWSA